MPLYRVLLHGSDFHVSTGGEVRPSDFFATRWISAEAEQLEELAIEAISEELQDLVEAAGEPELFVEEAELAEERPKGVEAGFSWFKHDDEEAGYEALEGERIAFW